LQLILLILGVLLLLLILGRLFRKLYHFPAPSYIGPLLDSDLRRWMYPPERLIERSGIESGMTVIDFGCGSGAFTTHVARAVGKEGEVYAVDIQSAMLKQLERKLAKAEFRDITNIELKQASAYELPFEDETIELVLMVAVLQEVPDRARALREIRRVLRPGGILAVTELLQDPDYPWRSTTIKLCQREGFIIDGNFGNMWEYTVRFKKG
jgi:ubiquinone/menaquinone biosynthesis C-methylase UbiE